MVSKARIIVWVTPIAPQSPRMAPSPSSKVRCPIGSAVGNSPHWLKIWAREPWASSDQGAGWVASQAIAVATNNPPATKVKSVLYTISAAMLGR